MSCLVTKLTKLTEPAKLTSIGLVLLVALVGHACSLGEGNGVVAGNLDVPNCWSGPFNLNPDFFAAVPFRETSLILRIQRGSDYQNFSDGLSILVDDIAAVRGDDHHAGHLGEAIPVGLSPDVTPPGHPIEPQSNPALVHATLYLNQSCRTQNVALHAVETVALNPDGSCVNVLGDAGSREEVCKNAVAPAQVGHSTITFNQLFNGNPDESDADNRLTDAKFELYLADPRETCPGPNPPPPPCRGVLKVPDDEKAHIHFYFQRGRPAQPFP